MSTLLSPPASPAVSNASPADSQPAPYSPPSYHADVVTRSLRIPGPAWAILGLTATFSLLWSRAKLLSQDEVFVLQTDSVHTLRELIHVQRTSPISLDPLVYHLAGFASLHLLHAQTPAIQAFALRLPSLLGFLLMQLCLLLFVRRFCAAQGGSTPASSERAALLALSLAPLTATVFYSAEARPYGLLLGLCGLILVSWQRATPNSGITRHHPNRTAALLTLSLSLALALNAHYFAVLLLCPLVAAELHRYLIRRRLGLSPDWPVIAAIVAGASAIVLTLPFQKAAGEFRVHYYNANSVDHHAISQAYRALLIDYTTLSFQTQQVIASFLLLGALGLAAALVYRLRTRTSARCADITLLLTLAALPFGGFLLGRLVTHSFEVRYVLGALPALCALLAFLLEPALRQRSVYRILLASVLLSVVVVSATRIATQRTRSRAFLASLQPPPTVLQALTSLPDRHIYLQNMGQFESAYMYDPLPAPKTPLTLLFSREQELRWDHHDTASLTAEHLSRFTDLPIVRWADVTTQPGPHLLILFHSGWDWTDQALQQSGAQVRPLGAALGGDAVLVTWPTSRSTPAPFP